jgi:hypothetical protein
LAWIIFGLSAPAIPFFPGPVGRGCPFPKEGKIYAAIDLINTTAKG